MMQMAGRNAVPLHIPARYMAVAVISMIAWIFLTPWMLPKLISAPLSYPVIAWVHLLTLGCIGSMIIGASIQLVPVAMQTPFPAERAAEWGWLVWIVGIVLFEFGFIREILPILAPGATLLGLVLVGYALAITSMFKRAPQRDTVAWHLLLASWFSIIGFVLGWLLALTNVNGVLGGMLLPILAAHIVVMAIGWVTLTILGVGYKLIGMFTLAERQFDTTRANISGVFIGIGTLAIASELVVTANRNVVTLGAILIGWGVVLSALELLRMYQQRMRKTIDVHMPVAIIAWKILIGGSALLIALSTQQSPDVQFMRLASATIWMVFTGAFLVAIMGFFYKISTFLIWLKTYAPLAGKVAVPPLDTMYSRQLAFIGLGFWVTGVVLITSCILNLIPLWWGWSIGLWIGGTLFAINIARIARHWRAPVTPVNRINIKSAT